MFALQASVADCDALPRFMLGYFASTNFPKAIPTASGLVQAEIESAIEAQIHRNHVFVELKAESANLSSSRYPMWPSGDLRGEAGWKSIDEQRGRIGELLELIPDIVWYHVKVVGVVRNVLLHASPRHRLAVDHLPFPPWRSFLTSIENTDHPITTRVAWLGIVQFQGEVHLQQLRSLQRRGQHGNFIEMNFKHGCEGTGGRRCRPFFAIGGQEWTSRMASRCWLVVRGGGRDRSRSGDGFVGFEAPLTRCSKSPQLILGEIRIPNCAPPRFSCPCEGFSLGLLSDGLAHRTAS